MKWIVLLVLCAAGGYAYWSYTESHPHLAACARFAELCGADKRERCETALDALVQSSGKEAIASSVQCLKKAENCAQGTGCVAGAAGKAGLKAAGDFFKGLGDSLAK